MKTTQLLTGLFACSLFLFPACNNDGGGEEQPTGGAAIEQTAASPSAAEEGPQIDPVAWTELQSLIPAKALGMPRTNQEEDKSSLGNLGFSHALGIYEKDGKRVEIQVMDAGSRKMIISTLAPWYLQGSIEKTSKEDQEQTTTIQGFPGYERFSAKENLNEISLVINDRFIVLVAGKQVALEELRKVVDGLDLAKISQY